MELKQYVMAEHLQSGDQTMAPEDSAWQAMPHVCEIECTSWLSSSHFNGENLNVIF